MDATSIALRPDVRDYALLGGRYTVDGWLEQGAVAATLVLAEAQRRAGVSGPAVEIGVHHGLYFLLLALVSEGGLAIDVFEDQHLNVDGSGKGDRAIFERHLARLHPSPEAVRIERADSLATSGEELDAWLEGRAPRLFSVDGGHTSRHAQHDLELATEIGSETSVIIVDDFENPAWPGVGVGVERFFGGDDRGFRPLALGDNKLYVVHESHLATYGEAIGNAAAACGALRERIELFGHPVQRIDFADPLDVLDAEARSTLARDPDNASGRFAPDARHVARLETGWSDVEPSGVWSQAETARLGILMIGDGARETAAHFRLHAFCPKETEPLDVDVSIEGDRLATWRFDDPESCDRTLRIPAKLTEAGQWQSLEFSIQNPRSPRELGLSDDDRTLGIALEAFHLVDGDG